MSESSLVPERQLVFSPSLAATIGLEEAILLQHLQEQFNHQQPQIRDNHAWIAVEISSILKAMPFWAAEDLQRISRNLVDKAVLLVENAPAHNSSRLVFALNEPLRSAPRAPSSFSAVTEPSQSPPRRGAGLLPQHWSPSEEVLQLLGLNHNIPREFALQQLEDFVFYWRERGEASHAWENKFRQQVISKWRRHQQEQAEAFRSDSQRPLDKHWQPSADAMEIMAHSEIDRDFIEQAIPEFILYWRERGAAPKELSSKFIQHIRIQWARYSSGLEKSTVPQRITDQWQPSIDVYDILRLSHIELDFARSLIPEFIVYWKDSNQPHTSWNSKFLQHVKYHWAKRHQLENIGQSHAQKPGSNPTGRTRDRSLQDDLTDTSWAE